MLILVLTASLALCGCGKHVTPAQPDATKAAADNASHSLVLFTMENGDTFKVELYPEYAPKTVENFLGLVSEGFYDGLTFHRIVDDFMAQGGDPALSGKDEAPSIPGEFTSNGFAQNTLHHDRGVISMARTNDPNSASSQFFICYSDRYSASLDGNYAAFGKVIEGMETVDSFLQVERTYNALGELAQPVTPIVIAHAEVVSE
ncbi:MAG: peptidylprolyl isomerase [Clostridia bacterium]|nr:peptidylprolyl isomerase [Clostridia bacterium]